MQTIKDLFRNYKYTVIEAEDGGFEVVTPTGIRAFFYKDMDDVTAIRYSHTIIRDEAFNEMRVFLTNKDRINHASEDR